MARTRRSNSKVQHSCNIASDCLRPRRTRDFAPDREMPSQDKIAELVPWCGSPMKGDEKGESQILLNRLFNSCLQV